MLPKGSIRYLASIVNMTKKVETELSDVSVVCKFLDVFPEELLGLPSDRQIEFDIELLPRTMPTSKVPYRMDPVVGKGKKKAS